MVFKEHKSEVAELTEQEASSFIKDVRRVAQAIHKAFTPNKINYGAFADTMKHLHFHLVPKYEGGPSWGGTFEMNPQQVYLSDEEYNELIDKVKKNL